MSARTSANVKGTCGKCYEEIKLIDDAVLPEHKRPGSATRRCPGSGTIAKDDLSAAGESVVRVLALTLHVANTATMSEKNAQRCARAVYWMFRDEPRFIDALLRGPR